MTSKLSKVLKTLWEIVASNESSFLIGDIEFARDERYGHEVRVLELFPSLWPPAAARKPVYARITQRVWNALDQETRDGLTPGTWIKAELAPVSYLLEDIRSLRLRSDLAPVDTKTLPGHRAMQDLAAQILAQREARKPPEPQ